jgi:hypothetical protein
MKPPLFPVRQQPDRREEGKSLGRKASPNPSKGGAKECFRKWAKWKIKNKLK